MFLGRGREGGRERIRRCLLLFLFLPLCSASRYMLEDACTLHRCWLAEGFASIGSALV